MDDVATRQALALIEDPRSRDAVDAERGFLAELGGDCDLPAGAHASAVGAVGVGGGATLEIEGLLASLDGHVVMRHRVAGVASEAEALGREVARHLLGAGGASLLDR